jgi:high affinity sulfate transporter 1
MSGLPILPSLHGYRREWLRADLTAGVLIVAIAIPLSMGMAEFAGMPPIAGLYSCVLPLVAYAAFGSSRQLVIALDASTAAIVAATVAPLAGGDPAAYAALAGGLTLLTGTMLLAAGTLRLGVVADFLSEPVLLGYQAGLAIVVIASQLPRMLGVPVDADTTIGRYADALSSSRDASAWSVTIALGTLVIVIGLRWWRPALPGALAATAAATLLVGLAGLQAHGVVVVGELPSGFPPIGVPDLSFSDLRGLLGGAAAIALVAAADTLVSSRAFAARNGYEVSANRDLVGLGSANLGAGLSGGITVSASAARTAVSESVGSRTQLAGLTAAALMAVVLLALTDLLHDVPVAALAAVVTAAVLRLFEPRAMRTLFRVRRAEFAIAITAMAGVAVIGVLEGVLIAMALSLIDFVRRTSRPHDAVLGVAPGRVGYHDVTRVREASVPPGALVYRFDAPLFYANAERFRSRVRSLARRRRDLRVVVIEASTISDVDVTAGRMLGELQQELAERGVRLVVADAVGPVRDLLVGDELREDFDASDMFDSVDEALRSTGVLHGGSLQARPPG